MLERIYDDLCVPLFDRCLDVWDILYASLSKNVIVSVFLLMFGVWELGLYRTCDREVAVDYQNDIHVARSVSV